MKKVLAILVAVMLLAAIIVPAAASAAAPPELTGYSAPGGGDGIWPLDAGMYDPNLDSEGIKNGTRIYNAFDMDMTTYVITPKAVPETVTGYEKVDAPADMTAGTWCVLTYDSSGTEYSYILLLDEEPSGEAPDTSAAPPAGPFSTPPELTAVAANDIGTWPMAAGAYDPSLDGKGILNGTHIYGCYDFDFTTYVITPKAVPDDIAGYTKVDAPGDMTAGTWCELVISGSPDYSYILVLDTEPTGGGNNSGETPPSQNYAVPRELVNFTEGGFWPLAAGMYDPNLDGKGIKNGTRVFNIFIMDMTTYVLTPFEVPNGITGYTKVDSPSVMTEATYCVLTFNSGGADYSYVLLYGAPSGDGGGATEPEKGGINWTYVIIGAAVVMVVVLIVVLNVAANKKKKEA